MEERSSRLVYEESSKVRKECRPAAVWGGEFSGQSNNNNWETDRNLGRYRPARQLKKRCTYNTVVDASNFGFVRTHIHHDIPFLCSQDLHL
jgi:hypothetical protein